jgi:hypothetical protein
MSINENIELTKRNKENQKEDETFITVELKSNDNSPSTRNDDRDLK